MEAINRPRAGESTVNSERPVIEISVGITRLYEQIEELRRVVPTLRISLSTIPFNPADSTEVAQAVSVWVGEIDSAFERYLGNPFIMSLATEAKTALHEWVFCRVAETQRKLPALDSHPSIE